MIEYRVTLLITMGHKERTTKVKRWYWQKAVTKQEAIEAVEERARATCGDNVVNTEIISIEAMSDEETPDSKN